MKQKIFRHRMCINKSKKYFYVQIINDLEGKTLFCVSTRNLQQPKMLNRSNVEELSKMIVGKLNEHKISNIFLDRTNLKYDGNVKTLADLCRKQGVKF